MEFTKKALMLLLLLIFLSTGCQVGDIAKFDGTGPIAVESRPVGWKAYGGGEHGALVKSSSETDRYAQVSFSKQRNFKFDKPLGGALSTSDGLIRHDGAAVYHHKINRLGISEGRLLTKSKNIQEIDYQESTLALRTPKGVFIKKPKGKLDHFYKGPSLALSLDMPRNALWIIKKVPGAVLEYWDLEKRELKLRIPLPAGLKSSRLKIARSKSLIAVYAHDRPLSNALFINGTKHEVISFSDITDGKAPTRSITRKDPPFLILNSQKGGKRIRSPKKTPSFGRIIGFNSGEFAVLHSRPRQQEFKVTIVDRQFKARVQQIPQSWPRHFDAIAWDDNGIVFIDNQTRYYIPATGKPYSKEIKASGEEAKRNTNRLFNVAIASAEAALYLPGNLAIGGYVTAFDLLNIGAPDNQGFLALTIVPLVIPYTFRLCESPF
ncbi:MAG: hypothetical protein P1V97_35645 [Planctomycetota bacterium]|nr:hypothetical protein [Planctomycetota bacterium]